MKKTDEMTAVATHRFRLDPERSKRQAGEHVTGDDNDREQDDPQHKRIVGISG